MNISLIAFITSGTLIILLVGLKMLQQRLGLLLFWPDTREKGEIFAQRQAKKVQRFTSGFSRRSMYIALHFILSKIRALFVYFQQKIDKRLVHLMNLIKGRQMLDATRGRASHFLNDVSKFKDKFRRQ
jgi:hypothetical protein